MHKSVFFLIIFINKTGEHKQELWTHSYSALFYNEICYTFYILIYNLKLTKNFNTVLIQYSLQSIQVFVLADFNTDGLQQTELVKIQIYNTGEPHSLNPC